MSALLQMRGISKDFPGQRALDRVDLDVGRGEVLALAGANGSGKSTLIKILAGFHVPDEGTIHAFGEEIWPASRSANVRQRLHFVHQDLGLIPSISAAENLALGSGYRTGGLGRIRWRKQRQAARSAIARFGGDFDVSRPVAQLSAAERTIVAIARALDAWADSDALLVVDEPTASLHGVEADKLFAAIGHVTAAGAGVIFVSHRISEILDLADRVAVLRDGRIVAARAVAGLTSDDLVEMIVGRKVEDLYAETPPPREDVVVSVKQLAGTRLRGISFELHRGEIIGITGLFGSGREELPELLYGSVGSTGGSITFAGVDADAGRRSIRDARRRGVALVPADRARLAVIATHTVRDNISLAQLQPLWRHGRIDRKRERTDVAAWMDVTDVRPRDQDRRFSQLSGGNQQKAVLAKWFRTAPQVIVLDEPTQGVDVGAKAAIYRLLAEAARDGAALVVCSSEAKDLAAICDRVIVLADGIPVAELHGQSLTEQRIVSASVGAHSPEPSTNGGHASH